MIELTKDDDFKTINDWLEKYLVSEKSFIPCKEELINLKSKDDSKSKGIYFWFMQKDGYQALNNFVPIQAIEPKYSRIIDNIEYNLIYLGTTGTGKQGKNNFYGRLDWHINQVHRESTIRQKESALSTLRTGLGSLLADDLIIPDTEIIINDFMKTYMRVFWIVYPDNKTLINGDEEILISEIKPLLNLKQNSNSWKTAIDNPTKLYKSRRNLIENNTKKRLGFYSKTDNLIIKSETENSKSNNKSSIINEHKFELNNEEYILTWRDKPRLTKNGNEQKVKPLLREYITRNDLPVQLVNSKGNDEVTYTLARKILEHFSDNVIKIVSKSIKLEAKLTLINTKNNLSNSIDNISNKLYLIPCSSSKISKEELENKPFKIENLEFNNELGEYRKIIIDNLIKAKSHKRNKPKDSIIDVANNFDFNLTAQAYKLYSKGRFYNNKASCSLNWSNEDQSKIYIVSALFGIIRADNYIPSYDLAMTDELNDCKEYAIGFWKGKLDAIIKDLLYDGKTVYNLLSENYKKCLNQNTQYLMTIPKIEFTASDSSGKRGKWLKDVLNNNSI